MHSHLHNLQYDSFHPSITVQNSMVYIRVEYSMITVFLLQNMVKYIMYSTVLFNSTIHVTGTITWQYCICGLRHLFIIDYPTFLLCIFIKYSTGYLLLWTEKFNKSFMMFIRSILIELLGRPEGALGTGMALPLGSDFILSFKLTFKF